MIYTNALSYSFCIKGIKIQYPISLKEIEELPENNLILVQPERYIVEYGTLTLIE